MRTPILADNAAMLVAAYNSLSAAQKESRTSVTQRNVLMALSSWKNGKIYRNSLVLRFRDETSHDVYTMELRDIIGMELRGDKFIIDSDGLVLTFDVVDELSSPTCPAIALG